MILSSFGRRLIALADPAAVKVALGIVATTTDEWASQPIGVPIPVFDNIAGVTAPPKDQTYRYVLLTAGQTGVGAYNQGIVTSESVSGSAPLVVATAVISLTGSPINGQTVQLINTERRFLRAGSAGTVQNDALENITGEVAMASSNGLVFGSAPVSGPFGVGSGTLANRPTPNAAEGRALTFDASKAVRTANETRAKNLGASFYMRIK